MQPSLLLTEPPAPSRGKRAAEVLFQWSGALAAARWRRSDLLRILMYHRFDLVPGAAALLERQCAHLRRHYTPLSLSVVARHLRDGTPFPRNAVTITVDDGHADFQRVAHPVFRRFGIPVTLYLTTDFIDRTDWLWFDQLEYVFRATAVETLVDESSGRTHALVEYADRRRAFMALAVQAKEMPEAGRRGLPRRLARQLGVSLPEQAPNEYQPVTWDGVRQMMREGVEIGAHTRSHPILSRLPDRASLSDEITGSMRRVEEATEARVLHFCYPNGRRADITPETVAEVRAAQFETAVTTIPGLVTPLDDPLLLARVGVGPETPERYFHRSVAGLRLS